MACGQSPKKQSEDFGVESTVYSIKKIEEKNKYYILHLKKGDYFYKVLSEKKSKNDCKQIILNGSYNLKLKSIWYNEIKLEDGRTFNSPLNVDCKFFKDNTEICLEKNPSYIKNIFMAENLIGLCIKD